MSAARNVAIVLALGAIVMLVPGGGNAGAAILELLVIAMLGPLGWLAIRLYRERRADIYGLGERNRAILYVSLGLATIALVATDRLLDTGLGTLAWLAMLAAAGYGAYVVFRAAREY